MTPPHDPTTEPLTAESDVKALIEFYELRGWPWLEAVAFEASRAIGTTPMDVLAWQRKRRR